MDIEINDKNNNYNNLSNANNNFIDMDYKNNNNIESNENTQSQDKIIFAKNKKSIYGVNQPSLKKNKNSTSGELTLCEGRLLNDLAEFKRSKIVGKICQIKLNDYIKTDSGTFELIVEFASFFSVKFIFSSDYPCSPPLIIYEKGLKPKNIFDNDGNVFIESIKKSNWTPSIWLSTLVYSIELLISSGTNNENNYFDNINDNNNNNQKCSSFFMNAKKQKYGKRKWDEYIKEYSESHSKDCFNIPELEKNLKQLKIK